MGSCDADGSCDAEPAWSLTGKFGESSEPEEEVLSIYYPLFINFRPFFDLLVFCVEDGDVFGGHWVSRPVRCWRAPHVAYSFE
jgi:hypothetical protein